MARFLWRCPNNVLQGVRACIALYFAAGMTSKVRRVPLDGLIQTAIAHMPHDEEVPW